MSMLIFASSERRWLCEIAAPFVLLFILPCRRMAKLIASFSVKYHFASIWPLLLLPLVLGLDCCWVALLGILARKAKSKYHPRDFASKVWAAARARSTTRSKAETLAACGKVNATLFALPCDCTPICFANRRAQFLLNAKYQDQKKLALADLRIQQIRAEGAGF